MMIKHAIYIYNAIGIGLNSFFVWLKIGDWFSFQAMSEFAGMVVPILALVWWCIKIIQTFKHKKK